MSKCIIDLFEVIEIDIEEAQRLSGTSCPGNAALQKVLKLHAVGNFC